METVGRTGFSTPQLAQIFDKLCELQAKDAFTVDKLNDALEDAAQSALAGIRTRQIPSGDANKLLGDYLRQLQRSYWEREYEKHRLLADEYERSSDERFMDELVETQRIKDEIKKLYGNYK